MGKVHFLGLFSVEFGVIDVLVITYPAPIRRYGINETAAWLRRDFVKYPVRCEIIYNILTEFRLSVKLIRPSKTYLNEIYIMVHKSKSY